MTDHLRPICEPVFEHHGRKFIAHCVLDDEDPRVLIVCLYRLPTTGCPEFMGCGVFGKKRFVGEVSGKRAGKKFQQRVWQAIRQEVG